MPRDYHRIFNTEIVSGVCESCTMHTLLVAINNTFFRCTNCGGDLEQKVNGVIKYIVADKEKKIDLTTPSLNGKNKV